jgi:hypothetical protein
MRAVAIVVMLGALGRAAHAQDKFEIQVYDAETAPRGELGIELHANYDDVVAAPGELHATLEPHVGVASWIELGAYLQTAVTTSGDALFAGAKLRAKLRLPERLWCDRLGLALNVELSAVPSRFEPNVYGSEIRPIVELAIDRLYAAINPIVAIDLHGALAGRPQLEPAAKLAARATRTLAFGVEGYAALGPLDDLGSEHATRLFAVADIAARRWDLDVGVGWSWGTPDRVVAKLILGVHPAKR